MNTTSFRRRQRRRAVFVWFGGEPTCRSDIRELIRYAGEKGYYQALVRTSVEPIPLSQANEALKRLREGRITGAAVLVP